jgi:hypothetical protein
MKTADPLFPVVKIKTLMVYQRKLPSYALVLPGGSPITSAHHVLCHFPEL